jgi:hypothetical protein
MNNLYVANLGYECPVPFLTPGFEVQIIVFGPGTSVLAEKSNLWVLKVNTSLYLILNLKY